MPLYVPPPRELLRVKSEVNFTVNSTSDQDITNMAGSFVAGAWPYKIEFYCPYAQVTTATVAQLFFSLKDVLNANAVLRNYEDDYPAATGFIRHLKAEFIFDPSPGAKSIKLAARQLQASDTVVLNGSSLVPFWMRVQEFAV